MDRPVFIASKDLFFITKVKEVARALDCQILSVKSDRSWDEQIPASSEGALLLIDLEKSVMTLADIAARTRLLQQNGCRCVCFFSHVHADVEQQAIELGLGEVMPRSLFVRILPELLG